VLRILRQCVAPVARRPVPRQASAPMKVPAGECTQEYENPRGHLGFYIERPGGRSRIACTSRAELH